MFEGGAEGDGQGLAGEVDEVGTALGVALDDQGSGVGVEGRSGAAALGLVEWRVGDGDGAALPVGEGCAAVEVARNGHSLVMRRMVSGVVLLALVRVRTCVTVCPEADWPKLSTDS